MNISKLFIETKLPDPLSKDELYDCFEKMKQGDMDARDKIINHNIKLVINEVMKNFSNYPYDLEELVSIGLVGLIKSVDTFDICKGIKFATYSTRCINNEILMFMRKEKKHINNTSLDQPIGTNKEGKELKVEDTLSDPNSDFVSEYEDNESYKVIRRVVEQLPERDKNITIKYFGFMHNRAMTQREISDELGISPSYVSRIIRRVLKDVSVELEKLGIIEKPGKSKNIRKEKTKRGEKGMAKKLQTIYEYFSKYTKEQVDEVLSKLNEEEKALITLRYGEDLNNPITSKEWNKEKNNRYYSVLLPKIKKLLVNPNYVFRNKRTKIVKENIISDAPIIVNIPDNELINKTQIEQSKEPILEPIFNEKTMVKEDYIKVLELLKTQNFGQMLNTLTPKEAIIVCLKLGYVDGKYYTTESISGFLGIDQEEVRESTKKVLLLYKDSINEFIDKAVEYVTDQPNVLLKRKDN